jgi:hypothetical protein
MTCNPVHASVPDVLSLLSMLLLVILLLLIFPAVDGIPAIAETLNVAGIPAVAEIPGLLAILLLLVPLSS